MSSAADRSVRQSAWIRAGTLDAVRQSGMLVAPGADRPILVVAHEGRIFAVDNRCPHMGFPLHRGSVENGILTCHWHHARFDLCSGCTFDLFADDVPVYDVEVRGEEVYVSSTPRQHDPVERGWKRLREGMEQNLGLIQAKCLIGLLKAGVDYRDVVRRVALFGAVNRDGWASGMTILTAMANLVPQLSEETAYLALYQGTRRVASDCAGVPPRRARMPLESKAVPLDRLQGWLIDWTRVRDRDAAERTLLTTVRSGAGAAELADAVFSAATERFYADTGHLLDFCNKAFELLDLIGWEHAEAVLPTLVAELVAARGGEELHEWHSPIDLVAPLRELECELPELLKAAGGETWEPDQERVLGLGEVMLGPDPLEILGAIRSALWEGARPEQVARALAYAAATRIARFGTANEFGDWITALHTFTYCSALHQAVKRSPSPTVFRGVLHGAVQVYLNRFLNVPPAPLPGERESLEAEPVDPDELRHRLLAALDRQQQVNAAARAVARYLQLGHPVGPLLDTLAMATVREDADFHTFQMLEAGIRQYREWSGHPAGARILVAVARYLAAHSPTQRAQLQTAQIAARLHRGEALFEESSLPETL